MTARISRALLGIRREEDKQEDSTGRDHEIGRNTVIGGEGPEAGVPPPDGKR